MTSLILKNISKIYDGKVKAVNNFNLTVEKGEFIVFVGPSGCGKSTLLRMIAGLENISEGELLFNNQIINDKAPSKRNVGMVFQNYALYPHLSVKENLQFPLKIQKKKKVDIEKRVLEVSDLVGLSDYLDRLPKQLSGGQRQRVALGRAIIKEPEVFLFDEPLSNLDAKLRTQMRNEITSLQKRLKITSIYVTHDQTEAMTMGDKIAVLDKGELQQFDTPENIYHKPSNKFVATFIGTPQINILPAEFLDNHSDEAHEIGIRPEDIFISENGKTFKIENIELLGHERLLYLTNEKNKITMRTTENYNLEIGKTINIDFDKDNIHIFTSSGSRLDA